MRGAAGGAVLAVFLAAFLMFTQGRGGYDVTVVFANASQLVKGNEVKVGGVKIGVVDSIELTRGYRARVKVHLDSGDSLVPLRRGTVAAVRNDALASLAGRYIALTPGPSSAPAIPDGGTLDVDHTRSSVDADQVLAGLDAPTRRNIKTLVRQGADVVGGRAGPQANAALRSLSPATSQTAALAGELNRDQRALARLVRESGEVSSALASRPADLESVTADARRAVGALASRTDELDSSLRQLPPTLRRTNTTLVNLRGAVGDLRPVVRAARPAARPLASTLLALGPFARRARAVTPRLRRTLNRAGAANDLTDVLRASSRLAGSAVPAFGSTTRTLKALQPILTEVRPYTPDLVGLTQGFAGSQGGYYDANGRYVRISLHANLFSADGVGDLVPLPSSDALTGLRTGVLRRCPGAATQTLPDRSNPYFEVPGTCDPKDNPR